MAKSTNWKLKRVRQKREKRRGKKIHEEDLPRQRRAERQEEREKAGTRVTRRNILANAKAIERQRQAYERGKL